MDVGNYIAALEDAGGRLGRAAETAGLDAAVPPCPKWTVRDLLQHVSGVHRWAASYVVSARRTMTTDERDAEFFAPVPDPVLLAHYQDGLDALVAALRQARTDLECWTFLPAPSSLAFWARRQAHETAIHCVDAEASAGMGSSFDAAFGIDGIEELLHGFLARPRGALVADPPITLAVRPTDADGVWSIRVEADRRVVTDTVSDGVGDADCVVSGPAADLYVLLWNRRDPSPPIAVAGDPTVLDHWRDHAWIRWT